MAMKFARSLLVKPSQILVVWLILVASQRLVLAQAAKESAGRSRQEEIQLGSQTAKGGFQNEDEIRDKFNNWRNDQDARDWLVAMNYRLTDIVAVSATKPHGEKADVEVRVKTDRGDSVEGISIKLVSNPDGFNQIDKRWLKTYVEMWNIPEEVHEPLRRFVGEVPPDKAGRDPRRQFLSEMDEKTQQLIIDFFTTNRQKIVSDLFAGQGDHAAGWLMVTLKSAGDSNTLQSKNPTVTASPDKTRTSLDKSRWVLCTTTEAAKFFGAGKVLITSAGSLRIGRITMQRKGGDNGRESANMLQFKINPVELFELPTRQEK